MSAKGIRAFLHRLRLRAGLFRWKNYATLRSVKVYDRFAQRIEDQWRYAAYDGSFCGTSCMRYIAIRHICRCVKQGVRE